ncbi:MAG: hypothetical protein KBC93_12750 [Candidatus Microthrix sp.]|nr:hypothetical protein [Candidatus Microthrix sp.]
MAWTTPRTWVSGETVTASLGNTHWRDNLSYLYDNRQGVGRRNAIINSHFEVWQRSTPVTLPSSTKTYYADRWAVYRAATGCSVARQTGPTGQKNAMRVQRDSGTSSTTLIYVYQALESLDTYRFAGQDAYLKVALRAGANFSAASSALSVRVIYGTGTDESPDTTWTGQTDALSTSQVITTTATTYDFGPIAIPSTATQIKLVFSFTPVGTASTNDWFEISAAQLSVDPAPDFERLPYAETLALCQRYYWQWGPGLDSGAVLLSGANWATTVAIGALRFPVTMRIAPAITFSSGGDFRVEASTVTYNGTAIDAPIITKTGARIDVTTSGMTAGDANWVSNTPDPTNAAMYVDAEL